MRFEPPTEGLAQYERVVWARKQGIGFFLPFSVIWIVVLGAGGIAVSFALVGVPLGVLVSTLVAVAMAFWTRALVVALRSKFFLTNQRVVATRGGVIFKQVPLSDFVGVPLAQCAEVAVDYLENGQPVYVVRIFDPVSADIVVRCTGLTEEAAAAFRELGNQTVCRYCGCKTFAHGSTCGNCGGSL